MPNPLNANVIFNPTDATEYQGVETYNLIEATGLLFYWANDLCMYCNDYSLITTSMTESYGFGSLTNLINQSELNITEDGVMQYEGDPDLPPIVSYENDHFIFYMYKYGFIAWISKADGETFLCRMD